MLKRESGDFVPSRPEEIISGQPMQGVDGDAGCAAQGHGSARFRTVFPSGMVQE